MGRGLETIHSTVCSSASIKIMLASHASCTSPRRWHRRVRRDPSQSSPQNFDAALSIHSLIIASMAATVTPCINLSIRQRPQLSTAEQAIWGHAAATTLSQNILLSPLGLREADNKLNIDHVSKCRDQIKARILDNQKTRRLPWPVLVGIFGLNRLLALQYATFSLVYP